MKNVSVLYLLARKCQVFSANDIKVLEIYFESEAKNMYWIIFLVCFLAKVTLTVRMKILYSLLRKL